MVAIWPYSVSSRPAEGISYTCGGDSKDFHEAFVDYGYVDYLFFLTLLGRGDGALLSSTLGRATTGDGAGMVELLGGGGILQPLGHEDQIDLLERASAGLGAAEID